MKNLNLIFFIALLIWVSSTIKGIDPREQKPADVQKFQLTAYLKILKQPKPVYDSCEPFYKRVFYNIDNVPSFYKKSIERTNIDQQIQRAKINNLKSSINKQKESPQSELDLPLDMFIYFNTNISCPKSYVTIEIQMTKIFKFSCQQQMLYMKPNGTEWRQYVHRCRIIVPFEKAKNVESFTYIIYSQVIDLRDEEAMILKGKNQALKLKKKMRISNSYEVEVVKREIPTKMIVLGDWAPIYVRPYFPIHQSLVHLIEQRKKQKQKSRFLHEYRITGLVIAGDIAYNLEDYGCMKYNWFMSELQKVSPYWPILLFPGNHDDITPGNRYLQAHSFEIGRLSVQDANYTRVKWMRFPNIANFVMFDPFWEIYSKATNDQTKQMTDYFKVTINEIQNKYPNEFTIVMSHYPIVCSQMDDNHCYGMTKTPATKSLLDFMSTQRNGKPRPVDMYVGSHMHQFQRVYPYANGSFQIGQKYIYGRGHMVSVVEGAAGCDYGMISQDFPRMNFSVSATYAKTGYAFMTIYGTADSTDKTKYKLNYLHVAAIPAPDYYEKIDQFTIYGQVPSKDLQGGDLFQIIKKKLSALNQQIDLFAGKLQKNDLRG